MQTVELNVWRNGLLQELLLVVPSEGSWDDALMEVDTRLSGTSSNSSGRIAQTTVDLGSRSVSLEELVVLVEMLKSKHSLLPVAVVATDAATQKVARQLTLNAYLMQPGGNLEHVASDILTGNNALYVSQTVRSGQRLVHSGPLVIAGDVNAGAEVVSESDILIFGTLRGLAHAGNLGNEKARIFAAHMRPQQIRIAGKIARSPEEPERGGPTTHIPEVARIESGEIQVFPV